MKMIDVVCTAKACAHQQIDVLLRKDAEGAYHLPLCSQCGEATERLWTTTGSVIGDDIPGGMMVYHGICNADGSPKRYDSKSDMRRAAAEKGLANIVRHVPTPGSDKSKHTSRWV